jgi:hypothetical protein
MDVAPTDALPIQGQHLSGWNVLPGGTQICLELTSVEGNVHRIVLPFDALSGLMMTLPRMLQSALNERFGDRSMRVVQPLGIWHIELHEPDSSLIMKLGTTDGFEVAFSLSGEHAVSLGTALLDARQDITHSLARRPN